MKLRDYQQRAVNDIRASYQRGNRSVVLVSPTGSGKTQIFSYLALGVAQNKKRVTILAHRKELLNQISKALTSWNVPHGLLLGGMIGLPRAPVVVASVFTLAKRVHHFPAPDLIITDECHHAIGSTYKKILQAFPNARSLGVTATPERLDGQGLGEVFDDMVMGPSVAELTAQAFLSPAEVYAPSVPDLRGVRQRGGDYVSSELEAVMDKPSITGNAVEHYRKLAYGKKTVVFCVSIKHAHDVAEEFRACGFTAQAVDGRMKDEDRDRAMSDFQNGRLQVMTSCDLISEGYDCGDIECGILLRPTQSLGLFLQQCGRLVRISPGKTKTIIIDAAGNTLRHGFIDEPRVWSLASREDARQKGEAVPRVQTCGVCFGMQSPGPICRKCGHVFQTAGRQVEHVDGELVQVARAEDYQGKGQSEYEKLFYILRNVAKQRGYDDPDKWAFGVASSKLAQERARERGHQDGTVNGLLPEELQEFRERTIERERVNKAMSKEDAIASDAEAQ